jgi:hypothetical protein
MSRKAVLRIMIHLPGDVLVLSSALAEQACQLFCGRVNLPLARTTCHAPQA